MFIQLLEQLLDLPALKFKMADLVRLDSKLKGKNLKVED